MSDADVLLAAVLASPADDVPRLIYADFLDELGTPADAARAEYIRLQCESARTTDETTKAREITLLQKHGPARLEAGHRLAAQVREKTLLQKHGTAWLAPLRAGGEALFSPSTHGEFRRGFVEVVWMPIPIFVQKARKLFARTPVNELKVTRAVWNDFNDLFASEWLGRLHTLDLSDRQFGDVLALRLTKSVPARNLKRLRLRACGLKDESAIMLADVRDWKLAELDVSLNPLTDAGLDVLRMRYGRAVRFDGPG